MKPPGCDSVIVRYGEIGVKSINTRIAMEKKLCSNLEEILKHRNISGKTERELGRIFIRTEEPEKAAKAACDCFGVVSTSPTKSIPSKKEKITKTILKTAKKRFKGESFAIKARCTETPFRSKEIEEKAGDLVRKETKAKVDLDSPDFTIYAECREKEAFVFLEKLPGVKGLPLGTQNKLVTLISGGIDSPVAAWKVMKRGCEIIPVYFDLEKYGGVDHIERAFETVRKLSKYAPNKDLRIRKIPAGEAIELLQKETEKTRMISYRRFMFKAAKKIAEKEHASGIVTGESIGQKSSQTIQNLSITSKTINIPIYRPLLSMDKQEIIDKAKSIGTFQDSTINTGCHKIAPNKPTTKATLKDVKQKEPNNLLNLAKKKAKETTIEKISKTQ